MPWRPRRHKTLDRVVRELREQRTGDDRLPRDHAGELRAERVKAYDAERGNSNERGYDATWRKLRLWHLRRQPLCVACERRGRLTPAEEVDHITPISRGGARLDPANLQSLCKSCHSAKTAREQRK